MLFRAADIPSDKAPTVPRDVRADEVRTAPAQREETAHAAGSFGRERGEGLDLQLAKFRDSLEP